MWTSLIFQLLVYGQIIFIYKINAWNCPFTDNIPNGECSCDLPHTLRCSGNLEALNILGNKLGSFSEYISLLDLTLYNVTTLKDAILPSAVLHGLVISSGEIKTLGPETFAKMAPNLEVLGLPNNHLAYIPTLALTKLPDLLRLDLSGNQIKVLNSDSFGNLSTINFLDLSRNALRQITPDAFSELKQLHTLRLKNNQITTALISKLINFPRLTQLDLSRNLLSEFLNIDSLPVMKALNNLQLSQNEITSIKTNAFHKFTNLSALYLDHNQIDVIEDDAFSNLLNLSDLNLSYNRIVAVSESTLAHLSNLKSLDLSHNYLRALSGDLIKSSKLLKVLHLDHNDISIISQTFVNNSLVLKRLTMSNNPLNCDCNLSNFVKWLENTTLSKEDKWSLICATPPIYENGILLNVFKEDLQCNENIIPYNKPKISLLSFDYDQNDLKLHWLLLNDVKVLKCKNIFVYEEELEAEYLIQSFYTSCNIINVNKIISMSLFKVKRLENFKNYRICLNSDNYNYCTRLFTLNENRHSLPINNESNSQIISIKYNVTNLLTMNINSNIKNACSINIKITKDDIIAYDKRVECDSSIVLKTIVYFSKPYKICANIVSEDVNKFSKPKCVIVSDDKTSVHSFENVIIIWILILMCIVVVILIWKIRTLFVGPKVVVQSYSLPEVKVIKTGYSKLQDTKC